MSSTIAVITPSFGPDFGLCAALHASVLAHSPDSVRHHIIVPRRDLALFQQLAGPRTEINDEADYLPRSIRAVPGLNLSVNLRRPYPPLRGWILQQIIKLAATARSDADAVLLVDSDIEFVRPFGPDTFRQDAAVRFYRKPDEIDERLPRHVIWHRVARTLLGLPAAPPPYPDYVSSLMAWDPSVVRRLLARVETVTGRRWTEAVGAHLHFSEWTLYGVFADALLDPAELAFSTDTTLCHSYWSEEPLTEPALRGFLTQTSPDDVAVMISAKSRTPIDIRQAAFTDFKPGSR